MSDYGHAQLIALKPTWLATAYAEIAADRLKDAS